MVSCTHLYSFILDVQSVKMNIYLADLYSTEHEYIFGQELVFIFSQILWLHAYETGDLESHTGTQGG